MIRKLIGIALATAAALLCTSSALARLDCSQASQAIDQVNVDEGRIASAADRHQKPAARASYLALISDLEAARAGPCSDGQVKDQLNAHDLTRWYAGAMFGYEKPAVASRHMRRDLVHLKRNAFDVRLPDLYALYLGETMQVSKAADLAWQPLPKNIADSK